MLPSQRTRRPTAGSVTRGTETGRPPRAPAASSVAPSTSDSPGRSEGGRSDEEIAKTTKVSGSASATSFTNRFSNDRHYKSSIELRAARNELLRLRDRLRMRLYERYGGRMGLLLKQFDSDSDGQISQEDFLRGIKTYNWPLSEHEARLLFAGVDEDGSGGLDFAELVAVFEPASLASGHAIAGGLNAGTRRAGSGGSPESAATSSTSRHHRRRGSDGSGIDAGAIADDHDGDDDDEGGGGGEGPGRSIIEDMEGWVHFTPEQVANIQSLGQFTPRGTYKPRREDPRITAIRRANKVHVSEEEIYEVVRGPKRPGASHDHDERDRHHHDDDDKDAEPIARVFEDGHVELGSSAFKGVGPSYDPLLKRFAQNDDEEAAAIKRVIGDRIRRRGADFFTAWKRFDENDRGFLTQAQFLGLCGPKGFDLGLNARGLQILLREVSDQGGAIEPLRFDAFLRSITTDTPTAQVMLDSKLRGLQALRDRVDTWARTHGTEDLKGSRSLADVAPPAAPPEPPGRSDLGTSQLFRSSYAVHPLVRTQVQGPAAMENAQRYTLFGKPTGDSVVTLRSPRSQFDNNDSLEVIAPSISRAEDRSTSRLGRTSSDNPALTTTSSMASLKPLNRSHGVATCWSDVAGRGPDAFGPSPADKSRTAAIRHRRGMMYAKSLPTLPVSTGLEPHVERVLQEAEQRHEKTWRTSMRPLLASTAALVQPAAGSLSAAFASESERLVRKSSLTTGSWERSIQHAERSSESLASLPASVMASSTRPLATQRALVRATRGHEALVRIQENRAREIEVARIRDEGRIAAKSAQALRYASAALGLRAGPADVDA